MQKDIALTGLTTTPSSHEAPDGDIAAMLNLINEDAALKPINKPYKVGTLEEGAKLWVHETPDYLHYIKRLADGTWWWSNDNINAVMPDATKQCLYVGEYSGTYNAEEMTDTFLSSLTKYTTDDLPASSVSLPANTIILVGEQLEKLNVGIRIKDGVTVSSKAKKKSAVEIGGISYTVYTINNGMDFTSDISVSVVDGWVRFTSDLDNTEEVTDLAYNGNVLTVASSDQPIQYVVWKTDSNSYVYLGQVPEVDIEFKLDGDVKARNYKSVVQCEKVSTEYDGEESQDYTDLLFVLQTKGVTQDELSWTDLQNYNVESGKTYRFVTSVGWVTSSLDGMDGTVKETIVSYIESTTSDGTKTTVEFKYTGTEEGYHDVSKDITIQEGMSLKLYHIWTKETSNGDYDQARGSSAWRVFTGSGEGQESTSGYCAKSTADNLATIIGLPTRYTRVYCETNGKFVHPFFVRYALKLYDGSFVYASAPQLMTPNWGVTPRMLVRYDTDDDDSAAGNSDVHAQAFVCDLYYRIKDISNLNSWKDIITDVVISITAPIIRMNGNAEWVEGTYQAKTYKKEEATFTDNYSLQESKRNLWDNLVDASNDDFVLDPPLLDGQAFEKHIQNVMASFYKLKSIKHDDITVDDWIKVDTTGFNIMYPETGVKVEYDTLNTGKLYADKLLSYNGRQHLANVRNEIDTRGCALSQTLPVDDGSIQYRLLVESKKNGQVFKVFTDWIAGNPDYAVYFFSQDSDVYQVTIYRLTTVEVGTHTYQTKAKYTFKTIEHELISGAYAYLVGKISWTQSTGDESTLASASPVYTLANSIYVSEVDNPFVYPSANAVQCGRGAVRNIAVNTETVSEGQFGEAPLYAFTDEETWVLSLADTGVYQTKQVLANSVCINADGVTGLTNGVVYTTVNGIMYAAGKQVQCISDSLRDAVSKYTLKHLGDIMTARELTDRGDYLPNYTYDGDWLTFLRNCGVVHDKVNERIIIYPADSELSYVYSLRSNQWCMMGVNIAGKIDRTGAQWVLLPNADGSQTIADLSDNQYSAEEDAETEYSKQYVITRPIGLDIADVHKRIKTMIMRGYFRKGSVACGIYGSRNLFDWHLIWTSKDQYLRCQSGTPYKYFIVVAVSDLAGDERLQGMSFDFDALDTDQLR